MRSRALAFCNALELSGIILMLIFAFIFQIALYELPCPLCLLQRIGFLGVAFGFLLNLRYGFRPSHYAMVLLSSLFTSFVALRQIALHVIPGTGTYGPAILGFHLYTWSFIASMIIVVTTTILLAIDRQYSAPQFQSRYWRYITQALFLLTVLLIMSNIISALLECGLSACPDNPMRYELLLLQ